MTTLDFDPRDHPDEWERIGTDSDGTPIYRPIDTVEGCGGCDNGEHCGACECCPYAATDPCAYEFDGHDTDGTEWHRCKTHDETAPSPDAPCAGWENGTPSRYDVIGHLTVTDETGYTHTVTIRREDLTTTNGAYRAIRDEVVETLRRVLEFNRTIPV